MPPEVAPANPDPAFRNADEFSTVTIAVRPEPVNTEMPSPALPLATLFRISARTRTFDVVLMSMPTSKLFSARTRSSVPEPASAMMP